MGLRDQTKQRMEKAKETPEKAGKGTSTVEPSHAPKASPSLVMGSRGSTEGRRKGIMVKLVIETAAEPTLRRILRELSWMMDPASLGDMFVWIYTQAHLHKEMGKHLREAIKHQKKYPEKNINMQTRRTNVMVPSHVTDWVLSVAEAPQIQLSTGLLLRYVLANWEAIKTMTGWVPAFTDPDANLWNRW